VMEPCACAIAGVRTRNARTIEPAANRAMKISPFFKRDG